MTTEMITKRLQLLKQAVPGSRRIALMYSMGQPDADRLLKSLAGPARTLDLAIIPGEIRGADGIELAFEEIVRQHAGGIILVGDGFTYQHRTRIMELANKHGLTCAGSAIEFAAAGALFSYGANFAAMYRRSAALIDRILKGANPATMPVEQANVYDLVVNLKTARALGIKLPAAFLLQATQTID